MNSLNKNILAIIFLLIFSSNIYSQECKADVYFISDIENVHIIINDSLYGVGKSFNTQLETGEYIVRILENSDRWDAKSFEDTLIIIECRKIELNYKFHSEQLLNTDPQNVYVFMNDSLIGFTPMFIKQSSANILLKKDEYSDKNISFSDLKNNQLIKLDFIGSEPKTNFVSSIWFKFLIGSAIALGATTAYYKLEADEKYTEYQITGDPELLEQTDKYDIISGVTFVALQINFGLIIYFLLTEY